MKKSKAFKVESSITDAFEAWCDSKSLIQGDVLAALMISVTKMSADERELLIDGLNEWGRESVGNTIHQAVVKGRQERKQSQKATG